MKGTKRHPIVRRALCVIATWLAVLSTLGLARAAEPSDPIESARLLSRTALELFEAGKWPEAYAKFVEARQLYDAPTIVLYMGHCQKFRGSLREARDLYAQVARQTLAADAPAQFQEAQRNARKELDAIQTRIPSIQIVVTGAPAERTHVVVDGVAVPASQLARVELDPGPHVIVASSAERGSVERRVSVKEWAHERVEISLAAPEVAGKSDPAPTQGSASVVPSIVAFSVGVAGVAVGTVTGLMHLDAVGDLESRCRPDGHCPTTDEGAGDEAEALAWASTIGFVVGGTGLAAGTILWLTRDTTVRTIRAANVAPTGVRAAFGPRSLRLWGTF